MGIVTDWLAHVYCQPMTAMSVKVAPVLPLYCVAPICYIGRAELQRDLDYLKAAVAAVECEGAFVPSTAPSDVGSNNHDATKEAFFEAGARQRCTRVLWRQGDPDRLIQVRNWYNLRPRQVR